MNHKPSHVYKLMVAAKDSSQVGYVNFHNFSTTPLMFIAELVRDANSVLMYMENENATLVECATTALILARPQSVTPNYDDETLQVNSKCFAKILVSTDEGMELVNPPEGLEVDTFPESSRLLLGLTTEEMLTTLKALRDPEMTLYSKGGTIIAEGWDLTVVRSCGGLEEDESDNTGAIVYDYATNTIYRTPLDIAEVGALYKGLV